MQEQRMDETVLHIAKTVRDHLLKNRGGSDMNNLMQYLNKYSFAEIDIWKNEELFIKNLFIFESITYKELRNIIKKHSTDCSDFSFSAEDHTYIKLENRTIMPYDIKYGIIKITAPVECEQSSQNSAGSQSYCLIC